MTLTVILLSIILSISITANVVLVWYNRQVVKNLFFVSNNIGDILGLIREYQEHLESLYEMEMFYGDSTLQGLIDHTKFIIEEIKEFEDIYSFTHEDQEEQEVPLNDQGD